MSLDAAISRIDQIVQFQEQLLTPRISSSSTGSTTGGVAIGTSDAVPTTSATSSATTTAATSGSGQADFASALADAQGASALSSATDVTAASSAPAAVSAMVEKANSLVGEPYVWGGGHSGWGTSSGYDCSGFVSAVLHAGGYLSSPQDTQTLPNSPGIASGPGRYVTIYDRTDAGQGSDHVIIDIGGQFYESGGRAGSWGGGGGVAQISAPSASYLASFNQILHPEGL